MKRTGKLSVRSSTSCRRKKAGQRTAIYGEVSLHTCTESQPTSRYNHRVYLLAKGLHEVSKPVCKTYDGDIQDIRHPCGDRFLEISKLARKNNRTASKEPRPSSPVISAGIRYRKPAGEINFKVTRSLFTPEHYCQKKEKDKVHFNNRLVFIENLLSILSRIMQMYYYVNKSCARESWLEMRTCM